MTTEQSSAEVLSKVWKQFAMAAERETGRPVSKAATSRNYLDSDDRLLTRWLNPGARTNWRIPLSRVQDVCRDLQASPELTDKLMMARFSELSQEDPKHPALVAAMWAFEHCERVDHGLTTDELQVLAAYRAQAQRFPRGLGGDPNEQSVLAHAFEQLLASAQAYQESIDDGPDELTLEGAMELKVRATKVVAALEEAGIKTAARRRKSAHASERSAEVQVKAYLKGLKSKRR